MKYPINKMYVCCPAENRQRSVHTMLHPPYPTHPPQQSTEEQADGPVKTSAHSSSKQNTLDTGDHYEEISSPRNQHITIHIRIIQQIVTRIRIIQQTTMHIRNIHIRSISRRLHAVSRATIQGLFNTVQKPHLLHCYPLHLLRVLTGERACLRLPYPLWCRSSTGSEKPSLQSAASS